ncbi:MAG: ribosome-binding factor A [Candidatus Uhrbacteria bacterium]|nr:ribosome-binding factor A [Candidatus Uhrbacteria bacterium]
MDLEHEKHVSHFHQALAESIVRGAELPIGLMVTLVRAEITGDAKYAKGTISVLPVSRTEEAIEALVRAEPEIKRELNKRLRLRIIPRLHWGIDTTEEHAAGIEETINELKRRGEL